MRAMEGEERLHRRGRLRGRKADTPQVRGEVAKGLHKGPERLPRPCQNPLTVAAFLYIQYVKPQPTRTTTGSAHS